MPRTYIKLTRVFKDLNVSYLRRQKHSRDIFWSQIHQVGPSATVAIMGVCLMVGGTWLPSLIHVSSNSMHRGTHLVSYINEDKQIFFFCPVC